MKIRFWGTRGSIPAPGPSTLRYGGNTSCVEVNLSDGGLLILDAGSGIRPMGAAIGPCDATLLLSHYHWDHIQGLPFFTPAYQKESSIRVWGPEFNGEGPYDLLYGQMLAPYFPAPASQWEGMRSFEVVNEKVPLEVGSATIRAGRLCHPGLTYGYRIEDGDRVVAYLSDNEPDAATPEELDHMVQLARGADLLIHDCQYTEPEYLPRRRWGHSTPRQCVEVAQAAGVKCLALFHHDPSHDDQQLEALAEETRALARDMEVIIAREGETIATGSRVASVHP
jgi:phosphoribosyl 1,2-cyclic phosphodiesterase